METKPMLAKTETAEAAKQAPDAETFQAAIRKVIPASVREAESQLSKHRREREKLSGERQAMQTKIFEEETQGRYDLSKLLKRDERAEIEARLPELNAAIERVDEKIRVASGNLSVLRDRHAAAVIEGLCKACRKELGGTAEVDAALEILKRLHATFKCAEDAFRSQGLKAPWADDPIPHVGRGKAIKGIEKQWGYFKGGGRFSNGAGSV